MKTKWRNKFLTMLGAQKKSKYHERYIWHVLFNFSGYGQQWIKIFPTAPLLSMYASLLKGPYLLTHWPIVGNNHAHFEYFKTLRVSWPQNGGRIRGNHSSIIFVFPRIRMGENFKIHHRHGTLSRSLHYGATRSLKLIEFRIASLMSY